MNIILVEGVETQRKKVVCKCGINTMMIYVYRFKELEIYCLEFLEKNMN